MANKVRFTDQLTVNSFGNVSPEAIITASGGVGNIVFTKANGNQITLPLAASASNATALITASANENVITFTFGDLSTFDVTVATGSGGGESIDTGSLLTTGSVSGNVLTFTKGDGTSFTMTVDTGSSLPSGVISSSIQISELGFVTSSATASFITNSQTSSMSVATASYALYAISASHEIIKEVSSSYADTASYVETAQTASIANFIPFNGNRSVSNQNQPLNIRNVNFGANGLADFINKVYFTNDGPVLDAQNITIEEFVLSGSTIATITATDNEGQAITFGTSSTYTDDFFRINSSTGVVTLNAKSTSSMNTFNDGGQLKSPFPVTATDTFNESGSLTYYIRITPNTSPIWSTTLNGSSATNVTESIAEDSTSGTDKDRYYFRDTEGDTLTIGSGSFSTHFTTAFALTLQSGYVRLDQITASLDFDLYPTYSFVLTASDEHYESGDDTDSIAYLPVLINVTDNQGPTIDATDLTGVNESGSSGDSAGNITSISDVEGNTVTISQFQLVSAFLNSDPTNNLTSSLGNVSLFNPASDPFQVTALSPFTVSRKTGQFLNADIANRYVYRATVRDDFDPGTDSALITIPIADHIPNTITISSVFNIIESAITNDRVKQTSTGIGGNDSTALAANSSVQRWAVTSTPDFIEPVNITGSITQFKLKSNLSGSATVGGDTITLQITASQDNFDTTIQQFEKTIDVELLVAPSLAEVSINSGNNLNTNGARPTGQNLVKININDGQPVGSKYDIDHSTWTFTPNAGQNIVAYRDTTITGTSGSYYVSASANLAAGDYGYTASVQDVKGFRAGTLQSDFEILQAGNGTLTGDNPSFIIESSTGTAQIKSTPDGYTGNQADLDVNYGETGFNGAAVQSFTSSNALIAVTNTGLLSVTGDISGSYTSGQDITSTITFRDQYDNIGTGTATVNVTNNVAPTVVYNITNNLLTASIANSGVTIGTVTANDSQGFNITDVTLGGTDASSFNLVETTGGPAANRVFNLQPSTNLSAATYNITVTAKDTYGQETTEAQALPVVVYPDVPEVYIYSSTRGSGAPIPANYNALLGDETTTGTPIKEWASGSLGNEGPITLSGGVMRLIGSASAGLVGSSLNTIVSSTIGTVNPTENEAGNHLIYLVYPSGSDPRLSGSPTSMGDAFGGSTLGEYLLYYFTNSVDKGIIGSQLNSFDLSTGYTASDGTIKTDYNRWTILGCNNSKFSSSSTKFYVVTTSGSAPA